MSKSATDMKDYLAAHVSTPLMCRQVQQVKKQINQRKKSLLWLILVCCLGFLCWGVYKQVKSRKRKHKAALW